MPDPTPEAPSPSPAPAADAKPTEPAAPAQPKPKTPDDELGEVLGKHGLTYKAKGKEHRVTSLDDVRRLLSRVGATDDIASETLQLRQEREAREATLKSLGRLPPRQRLAALKQLGLDPRLVREATEEEILAEAERAEAQKALTPRERELQRQLAEQEAELAKHREETTKAERQRQEEAVVAEARQLYAQAEGAMLKALQAAKVPPALAPRLLPGMLELYERSRLLGYEPTVDELAQAAHDQRAGMVRDYLTGMGPAALLEMLRGIDLDEKGADGTVAKKNMLRLMLAAERDRIRGVVGAPPVPAEQPRLAPRPATNGEPSLSEKLAAWRTFGGEAAFKSRE